MKKLLIFFLFTFIFYSCQPEVEKSKEPLNSASLKKLIDLAVNGNSTANDTLSGLVDFSFPANSNYADLKIDSFHLNKKKYFTLLLQYGNPVYNRFAVYDSLLKSFLIDKSLNGILSSEIYKSGESILITLTETFLTKDTLELDRFSIYKISADTVQLALRIFTKLKTPVNEFYQKIIRFSGDTIFTSLSSLRRSTISGADTFTVNDKNKFTSSRNLFDQFVLGEINKFSKEIVNPQITDKTDALASAKIEKTADADYSLELNSNWSEVRDFTVTEFLSKRLKGIKYINNLMGAEIFVIQLPAEESFETLLNTKLNVSTEGVYLIKSSDKLSDDKNGFQFFEYSCNEKKYLIIIRAAKNSFNNNYKNLLDIVKSFEINCNV